LLSDTPPNDQPQKARAMPSLTGTTPTEKASQYLQQLAKHFGHKMEGVAFTPTDATIPFEFASVQLTADGATLTAHFESVDPAMVERAKMVIDKHLARFAFREGFEKMTWSEQG